ncbi:hypothetical protein ACOSP7_000853 [Xanthoceras sorbifolium]
MVDEGLKAEGIRRLSLSLVGKIVSNREVNREAFRNTIASIWRTKNEVEVESIGVNLFVFRFGCFWDRKRVLEGGPWSFDKNLLALKEAVGEVCSALLCYERLPNFCFYCGCMGHLLRECHVNKLGVLEAAELKFGGWLRAPNDSSWGLGVNVPSQGFVPGIGSYVVECGRELSISEGFSST